VADAGPRQ